MKAKRLFFGVRGGHDLPVELLQLGLVVEQFELAGSAGHEQKDHALGLGRKMRWRAAKRIRQIDRAASCGRVAGQ